MRPRRRHALRWSSLAMCGWVLMLCAPVHAAGQAQLEEQPWRIARIPLGMPVEAALDGQYLEGIYTDELRPFLKDSYARPAGPVYSIRSTLRLPPALQHNPSGTRWLELWFSSVETGRRAFWIGTEEPQRRGATESDVLAQLEQRFGTPTQRLEQVTPFSRQVVLVFIAPDVAAGRRESVINAVAAAQRGTPPMAPSLRDLRQKAQWLGPQFRGALASYRIDVNRQVNVLALELIDMELAASVLALEP